MSIKSKKSKAEKKKSSSKKNKKDDKPVKKKNSSVTKKKSSLKQKNKDKDKSAKKNNNKSSKSHSKYTSPPSIKKDINAKSSKKDINAKKSSKPSSAKTNLKKGNTSSFNMKDFSLKKTMAQTTSKKSEKASSSLPDKASQTKSSKNVSDSKSASVNKESWKKKYSFEDELKAGKETIKEIPAVVIEPKSAEKDEITNDKIKTITSSVTTPKFSTSFLESNSDKEPPGKYEMEFLVRCSPDLLFEFLYTPSGLSEWFCDDVNIRNGVYTFNWNGEIGQARLLKMVEGKKIRYQWVNRTDGAYFEFRIVKDELTGDVSLFITDFADPPDDIEGGKRLWQHQIERLLKLIGSLY